MFDNFEYLSRRYDKRDYGWRAIVIWWYQDFARDFFTHVSYHFSLPYE